MINLDDTKCLERIADALEKIAHDNAPENQLYCIEDTDNGFKVEKLGVV